MKNRLDKELVGRGLVTTRSQAESYIKLGLVKVDGEVETKPGHLVGADSKITLGQSEQYVSRAGLKLASVAEKLNLNFKNKVVLDVGSSTGGFTDYALKHGAKLVIAVDVGTNQLHPSLLGNNRIELHEKTDIRDLNRLSRPADIVLIDVSFISLKEILPSVDELVGKGSQIIAMVKPQFEAGAQQINKGVVKNDRLRRQILKDFETWSRKHFVIVDKSDSDVAGAKGNLERFYSLKKIG